MTIGGPVRGVNVLHNFYLVRSKLPPRSVTQFPNMMHRHVGSLGCPADTTRVRRHADTLLISYPDRRAAVQSMAVYQMPRTSATLVLPPFQFTSLAHIPRSPI